jgi:hypothetical protein
VELALSFHLKDDLRRGKVSVHGEFGTKRHCYGSCIFYPEKNENCWNISSSFIKYLGEISMVKECEYLRLNLIRVIK